MVASTINKDNGEKSDLQCTTKHHYSPLLTATLLNFKLPPTKNLKNYLFIVPVKTHLLSKTLQNYYSFSSIQKYLFTDIKKNII